MCGVGGDGQTVGQIAADDLDHHEGRAQNAGHYQLPSGRPVYAAAHRVYGMAVHATDRALGQRLLPTDVSALAVGQQRDGAIVGDTVFRVTAQTMRKKYQHAQFGDNYFLDKTYSKVFSEHIAWVNAI